MTAMTTAGIAELLLQDSLDEALAASAASVKAQAGSPARRMIHAELCALSGDLEKADAHAKIAQRLLHPGDAAAPPLFRQHLRGLEARERWWRDGSVPDFPAGPSACDRAALALNVAFRAGNAESIRRKAAALEELRGMRPALWNGTDIPDLRDLDDRLPHAVEAVTSGGHYLWLDMARITRLTFTAPARPFDLCCRRARVVLRDGSAADILIPVVYPDPRTAAQRLASETDFEDMPGGLTVGRGQRLYLSGGDASAILDARDIDFGTADD